MKEIPETAEVSGRIILMYLSAVNQQNIQPYVDRHNLADLQDDQGTR